MAISNGLKPEKNAATMDRISHIPDSVLYHILSFLPTKTAVTTSILSRRWRHLWKHLQVFDFCELSFPSRKRFVVFVYSVLAMRRTRDIRKLYVSCHRWLTVVDHMATWIRAATGPHLQELKLTLPTTDSDDHLFLPFSVFTCSRLVSLTLLGSLRVEGLQSVYLPSHKTLILETDSVVPTDAIFSGCPILETLDLTFTIGLFSDGSLSKIRAPSSLKSLTFAYHQTFGEIEDLEIDTPSLEYLSITMNANSSQSSVINLQNVVEVHLDFNGMDGHFDFILKLLEALTRTQVLVLHLSTVEHLLYAPILDFPEFGFLLRVELSVPNVNSDFLVKFVQKCGMLQVLTLQVLTIEWKKEQRLLGSWAQPINDPNCLRSHLIIFECRGYQDYASEQALIAYVLQKGLVLKTMTIHTDSSLDLEKKYHILKKLSAIPRVSNMCELNFD